MLKQLKNWLKTEKTKEIFDIILYGSSVKGKINPRDVDIVIIFKTGTLKERLEKTQKIKRKIKLKNIDIKSILIEELFKEEFFAKTGIILEGISIIDNKPLSQKLGFKSFSLFTYNLKNKTHTEKVKFNYILSGRQDQGIIGLLNGQHLAPGIIQIPLSSSLEFEEILKKQKIEYQKNNILIEE